MSKLMAKGKLVGVACLSGLLLSACASTPEECDPSQDQGFFGKMGCVVTGSYEARVESKQEKAEKLKAEIAMINEMTRDIHAQNRALMGDYFARQKVLDDTKERLWNLESQLASKKALSLELEEKIDGLQDQLAKMNTKSAASQSIAKKEKERDELLAQIQALEDSMAGVY